MASVTDWMRESAKFMCEDMPQSFSGLDDAVGDLFTAVSNLRENNEPAATAIIGAYMVHRFFEDGVEEIHLTRNVSTVVLFEEEAECRAYGWVPQIVLDDPLDDDLDE